MDNPVQTVDTPEAPAPAGEYKYFQIGDLQFFTSLKTDKIDEALPKAQAAFKPVKKSRNRHSSQGGAAYATLDDDYTAVREALNSNDIFLTQPPVSIGDKGVSVLTMLRHKSTQWIACRFSMPMDRMSAHGVGSAVTYCKRYSVEGLLGINGEEDDDGNGGDGGQGNTRAQSAPKGKSPPKQGNVANPQQPPAQPAKPSTPAAANTQTPPAAQGSTQKPPLQNHAPGAKKPDGWGEGTGGEYIIPEGKYRGKKIKDVNPNELVKNLTYFLQLPKTPDWVKRYDEEFKIYSASYYDPQPGDQP